MTEASWKRRFTIGQVMLLVAILAVELAWLPTVLAALAAPITVVGAWLQGRQRRRFVLGILATSIAGIILLPAFCPISCRIGQRPLTIRFTVIDARTRRPIAGASIRLAYPYAPPEDATRAVTEGEGRAALEHEFRTTGGAAPISGQVARLDATWLEVTAEGYRPIRADLAEFCGKRHLPGDNPPTASIALIPDEPPSAGPLADLAGGYFRCVRPFEGSTSLWLYADGRFTRERRGDSGVAERVVGTVRRAEWRLTLVPSGPDAGPPDILIPARWGSRMYLIGEGEAREEFLQDVTRHREPRDGPFGRTLLREGDWGREAEGGPDMPPEPEPGGRIETAETEEARP